MMLKRFAEPANPLVEEHISFYVVTITLFLARPVAGLSNTPTDPGRIKIILIERGSARMGGENWRAREDSNL